MDNIKIIRLHSGEDIIASFNEEDGSVIVNNPMTVFFKRMPTGKAVMMMMPWLPVEIISFNTASIHNEDILTVIEPSEHLIEYYARTVEDLTQKVEEEKQDLERKLLNEDDEEGTIKEFVERMIHNKTIH